MAANRKPMAPDDPRRKNLRPFKKGQIGNPTGRNGSERRVLFNRFMDEAIKIGADGGSQERFAILMRLMWGDALRDRGTRRYLMDQAIGASPKVVELSGPGGAPIETREAKKTSAELRKELAELLGKDTLGPPKKEQGDETDADVDSDLGTDADGG